MITYLATVFVTILIVIDSDRVNMSNALIGGSLIE